MRTLRYYDRMGLLVPSTYTEAGYRLYNDSDLLRLQQILALKFLGFSLEEIRALLKSGPQGLGEILAQQKAMLREKQARLSAVIQAIEETEQLLQTDQCDWGDWEPIVKVIRVMQMDNNKDWVKQYFTDEQQRTMEELSQQSYSEEARQQIAQRSQAWTEADQRRADEQWAWVDSELHRLVAAGADPAGPEAQAWAKFRSDLLAQFTQRSPQIEAGLQQWWQNYYALPEQERPFERPKLTEAEQTFMERALAIYDTTEGNAAG